MPERDASSAGSDVARSAFARTDTQEELPTAQVHRFVVGLDAGPRPMLDDEAARLDDPFARLLLRRGESPMTVSEVLKGIDAATQPGDPLRRQLTFLVGEGSQILWTEDTADIDRGLRLVVTRGSDNLIDVIVSTGATGDERRRFLQVMGWDDTNGVFHFYERHGDTWVWAGNSSHALSPPSRGEGPFDSHVNGSMVVKELKAPWIHWHSVSASVPPEVFPPGDPARQDPLLTRKSGAELLEAAVVRPGIERWTDSRLARRTKADGTAEHVPELLLQLLDTTTINIVSSPQLSRTVGPDDRLALPVTFFVDSDTLAESLGLPAPPMFSAPGQSYLDALEHFEVALVSGRFRQDGDTHFAFAVPERAFEDVAVVRKCLDIGLITDRFVACALMVDFANPVFSTVRPRLLRYVPDTATLTDSSSDLSEQIVAAVEQAATNTPGGSPEREFLASWQLGDGWRGEFGRRLEAYYTAVQQRLDDPDGFEAIFRLAESRRQRVRRMELSEGRSLLFARTNIDRAARPLVMRPDATVAEE